MQFCVKQNLRNSNTKNFKTAFLAAFRPTLLAFMLIMFSSFHNIKVVWRYAFRTLCQCRPFKGVDLTGLLGGYKRRLGSGNPSRVQGRSFFCETTHNIYVKIKQTTVAVTRVDILNDFTSKILGGHYHRCPPS